MLLVRERKDGLWTPPGGLVDPEESPSEAAIRELHEESGYTGKAVRVLAVLDRNRHEHPPHAYHFYKLMFLCELTGGKATKGLETTDVAFFDKEALLPLSPGRITRRQVERLFDQVKAHALTADFD